jgi:AraC-like DNA-binding protein
MILRGVFMKHYPWDQLSVFVHSAGSYEEGKFWSIPYRKNPFTALWYLLKGNIAVTFGTQTVRAAPGDVLLIPTGTPFSAKFERGCEFQHTLAIRFTLYTQEQLDWFDLYRLPYLIDTNVPEEWARNFRRIIELMQPEKHSISRMEANAVLQIQLSGLIEKHLYNLKTVEKHDNSKQAKVFRIVRWMEEHISEKFTLADLAQLIHVSTDYLNDLFQSVLGEPPIHYANLLRLSKAKQLLVQNELTVKEISQRVGFSDPQYFSRLFAKTEGLPPSQYRKALEQL